MEALMQDLKGRIIDALKLEEVAAEDIGDDDPLFGGGLGLDSIDALELVVMLEKDFGIVVQDRKAGEAAFVSIRALAQFIAERRKQP